MHEPNANTPAEHAADMAIKSNAVPEQFKGEDGTIDRDALVATYAAMNEPAPEAAPTPAPEAVAEVATEAAAEAIAPEVPSTPQETMSDMLDSAPDTTAPSVWDRVAEEAKGGSISESTITELRAAGVPDAVINGYTSGLKAQADQRTAQAADAVGGVDNLKAAMAYAKANYTPEQTEALKAQLNGPLWEATLKGLANQAGIGASPAPAPASPSTSGPASVPSTEGILPFNSQAEMTAAIRDPRYNVDTDYQRWVQARIRANAGV